MADKFKVYSMGKLGGNSLDLEKRELAGVNAEEGCDLHGDNESPRYLMVDGTKTANGALFILNIQP